jgi:2-oxoglutarate dehydrogenase E2 component (dihydrolipoamide succinyltransferase)
MAVPIKVPTVGESITEGILSRWLKKDGDRVRTDEPLFELETDKATGEVPSPATGTLHIQVKEGEKVAIGAVVGQVEEGAAAPRPEPAPAPTNSQSHPAPKAEPRPQPAPTPARVTPEPPPSEEGPIPLSPSARQLAADMGIDVRLVPGTGRGGRVTKEDVLAYLERRPTARMEAAAPAETPATPAILAPPQPIPAPAAPEASRDGRGETRQRLTTIRQRIAERLVAAQHAAALLTTFNEADLSAVMALRAKYKEEFQKKHGVGLGFMSFFVRAVVEALRAFPMVNSRIDGNDIVAPNYCDIGVAVSTEKGLMVPVLRDAQRLSFAGIERGIAELAEKARTGKIAVTDLQGGTFTITNGGVFGSLLSTPIVNPPQSAILGMHAIQKRPVVVDDQVVVRPMMYLALSYDHRLIDGREAVSFLVQIKKGVENPERLLLEV